MLVDNYKPFEIDPTLGMIMKNNRERFDKIVAELGKSVITAVHDDIKKARHLVAQIDPKETSSRTILDTYVEAYFCLFGNTRYDFFGSFSFKFEKCPLLFDRICDKLIEQHRAECICHLGSFGGRYTHHYISKTLDAFAHNRFPTVRNYVCDLASKGDVHSYPASDELFAKLCRIVRENSTLEYFTIHGLNLSSFQFKNFLEIVQGNTTLKLVQIDLTLDQRVHLDEIQTAIEEMGLSSRVKVFDMHAITYDMV